MRFLRETENLEDIPEEFKESPEGVKALELAQESAYSREELEAYDEYLDAVRVAQTIRNDAHKEGREEERKKNEEEKKTIAPKMLAKGTRLEDVNEFTGFSMEIVQSLL